MSKATQFRREADKRYNGRRHPKGFVYRTKGEGGFGLWAQFYPCPSLLSNGKRRRGHFSEQARHVWEQQLKLLACVIGCGGGGRGIDNKRRQDGLGTWWCTAGRHPIPKSQIIATSR